MVSAPAPCNLVLLERSSALVNVYPEARRVTRSGHTVDMGFAAEHSRALDLNAPSMKKLINLSGLTPPVGASPGELRVWLKVNGLLDGGSGNVQHSKVVAQQPAKNPATRRLPPIASATNGADAVSYAKAAPPAGGGGVQSKARAGGGVQSKARRSDGLEKVVVCITRGADGALGIELAEDASGHPTIKVVVSGGPCDRQLKVHDRIVSVDGRQSETAKSVVDAIRRIKTAAIRFTVLRAASPAEPSELPSVLETDQETEEIASHASDSTSDSGHTEAPQLRAKSARGSRLPKASERSRSQSMPLAAPASVPPVPPPVPPSVLQTDASMAGMSAHALVANPHGMPIGPYAAAHQQYQAAQQWQAQQAQQAWAQHYRQQLSAQQIQMQHAWMQQQMQMPLGAQLGARPLPATTPGYAPPMMSPY